MHENAEQLIPGLAEWNNGNGIDVHGYLSCIARYDHAVAYATLFWPDFVLHDDCVFFHPPDPDTYRNWMTQCKGDRAQVEAVMNHHHIVDIFLNSEIEPTREAVLHLGRLLKDMWQCRLRASFPERRFKVEFYDDDSDDLLDYQITVFQERE